MKLTADNPRCHLCESSAIVELQNRLTERDYLYCQAHKPDLWPGKNPHLKIVRYRSAPDSVTSRLMAMAEGSPEHESFRAEMCDLLILRGEGACRYYLSKLTDSDQFALWDTEFVENACEFLMDFTNGAAKSFTIDLSNVGNFKALFKQAFEVSRHKQKPTLTIQERAIVVLVNHPSWSDDAIAKQVPTTVKQLKRNSDYHALRAATKPPGEKQSLVG